MKYFILVLLGIFIINMSAGIAAGSSLDFKIEYTDKDEIIVYQNGKIVAFDLLKNIEKVHTEFSIVKAPDSFSKEKKELTNLLNLEAKWVSGKRFIRIKSVSGNLIDIPISFADHVEILRYKASSLKNFPLPRMTPIERERYDKLVSKIREKVNQKSEELLNLKKEVAGDVTVVKSSTPLEKVIADSIQKSGDIFMLILDGLPYLIDTTSGTAANIDLGPTLELRVQVTGNISCTGMSTSPMTSPTMRVKLNQYYAVLNPSLDITYEHSDKLIFVDTIQGNANCVESPDRIFASSFEEGAQ